MKYIKSFEQAFKQIETDPEVGDCVVFCFWKFNFGKQEFVKYEYIGKIIEIGDPKERNKYSIITNKVDRLHKKGIWNVDIGEIERYASPEEKEEIELFLRANKYNL